MPERKYIHTSTQAVRWCDIDAYQHVQHQAYFSYMVDARWEWYHANKPEQLRDPLMPIVHLEMSYLRPIFYPGNIIIKLYTTRANDRTWVVEHELFQESKPNKLCAKGSVELIYVDPQTMKSQKIPDDFREFINSGDKIESLSD